METQTPTSQKTTPTPIKDHSYITKLPTFADRGAAIAKRLEEVKANPKYQALPEEHKTRVRADLYKKYVPASYSGFHLPIPDEKTWVEATGRDTNHIMSDKKLSDTYGSQGTNSDYWRHNKETNQDLGAGAAKSVAYVKLFGAKVANRAFMGMFDLAQHFSHEHNLSDLMILNSTEAKRREEFLKTNTMRMVKTIEDTQRSKIQSADFWFQTHPRDTTIGRLDGMIGEQVATLPLYEAVGAFGAGAKAIGYTSKIPLTAKLATSPIGRWVSKRLIEATDGYLASLITSGGNTKEAESGAIGFAASGAVLGGAGKILKIAAAPLIKKWTANTISMGGKPFAQELTHSAMARSYSDWVDAKPTEDTILAERTAWKKQSQEKAKLDVIMDKLHQGEKVSLNSIAVAQFKKNLNQLSKNQRALVLAKRMDLIEQAAVEAPVHLPELHRDEVEQTISKARAINPTMNAFMAEDEKLFGAKFADVVTENQSNQIAHETGIANESAAGRKVRKVNKEAEPSSSDRTVESSASLNAYYNDAVSYLRAPRNRKELQEAISDRSASAYDKLYSKLKEADGGKIQFETPIQRLLYHYHLAKDLDPVMKRSLQDSIERQLRKTQGWENLTTTQVKQAAREQAGYLNNHLHVYAKTGKFYNGDNIYASTSLGGPQSWTKWQVQMNSEVLTDIRAKTLKALKQHPDAAKGYKTSFSVLQRLAMSAGNPEEFLKYQKGIEEMSRAATATAQGKSIQLFK